MTRIREVHRSRLSLSCWYSPCPDSFYCSCGYRWCASPPIFASLCSFSPRIFTLLTSLHLSLQQSSLLLIDTTSHILFVIVSSLSCLSSPRPYCILVLLIHLLLLVTIVGALLLISSHLCDPILLVTLPLRYHFNYPGFNRITLIMVVSFLSWIPHFFLP